MFLIDDFCIIETFDLADRSYVSDNQCEISHDTTEDAEKEEVKDDWMKLHRK